MAGCYSMKTKFISLYKSLVRIREIVSISDCMSENQFRQQEECMAENCVSPTLCLRSLIICCIFSSIRSNLSADPSLYCSLKTPGNSVTRFHVPCHKWHNTDTGVINCHVTTCLSLCLHFSFLHSLSRNILSCRRLRLRLHPCMRSSPTERIKK